MAAAATVHVQSHQTSGTVSSVNGASGSGACGTAGMPGDFALNSKGTPYTVDVGAPSTVFKEHGVSNPSFANVCAGDQVRALGTVSTNDVVTATEVIVTPPHAQHVSGPVASVNGAGAPGVCGTSGTAGDFTLTAKGTTYTVDVGNPSTTFEEHGVSAPSFADVCVGATVRAVGAMASADVVTATTVVVIPPHPQHVSGTVASVNGTSVPGACGTAGASGDFTVASHNATDTVPVGDPSPTFKEHGVSEPSFADVCVGVKVAVMGAVANGMVTPTKVTVIPPRPEHLSGTVASVNGTGVSGTCGTPDTDGSFTLTATADRTVDVDVPTTTFKEKGVSTPSFADVCVGAKVRVVGAASPGDVVAATLVTVVPPRPRQVSGTVASVNGTSTCGRSGTSGTFTLTSGATTYTVDVGDLSTIFKEHGVSEPSFAAVCAGDKVKARGTISNSKTITAYDVVIETPAK